VKVGGLFFLMANVFESLPFPAGEGIGAEVDTSKFGAEKTIVATGPFDASITVEGSGDGIVFAPIFTFNSPGTRVLSVSATKMRIRVENVKSIVSPSVEVAAEEVDNRSVTLDVPAGNGIGASSNVELFGRFTTFYISGEYSGTVTIEASENGSDFFACVTFAQSTVLSEQKSRDVVAKFFRVVRVGIDPRAPGLPIVEVAAADDTASGSMTDELVKVTVDDTTPGYLDGKIFLAEGSGLRKTVLNPGGDEDLELEVFRADIDNIDTAPPVTVRGANNLLGASTELARAEHVHRLELQVEDEGALEGARPTINFVGVGVTATDDAGNDRVDITIPGTSDGGAMVKRSMFSAVNVQTSSGIFVDAFGGASLLVPINGDYWAIFEGEGMNQNANAVMQLSVSINGIGPSIAAAERKSEGSASDNRWVGTTVQLGTLVAGDTIHGIFRKFSGSGTVELNNRHISIFLVQ
jgi:hypothetical protein